MGPLVYHFLDRNEARSSPAVRAYWHWLAHWLVHAVLQTQLAKALYLVTPAE
jgi:hypothetical protein